jgi:protein TonB
VAPSFPLAARQRSLEGWVDVRFVVRSDGSVGDVAIMGAEPVGIFEQAALEAVHRWRYRPIVRDGQAVSQTTRVRVRFAMQP